MKFNVKRTQILIYLLIISMILPACGQVPEAERVEGEIYVQESSVAETEQLPYALTCETAIAHAGTNTDAHAGANAHLGTDTKPHSDAYVPP